jgi:hypothetical protein
VVVYAFRQIKRREVNFSAYDLELTIIIFVLKNIKALFIWDSRTNLY